MNIIDQLQDFDLELLTGGSGDAELQYRAFAPFFRDLFRNRLVYKERFTAVIEVSDFVVTEKGYGGIATPLYWLHVPDYRRDYAATDPTWEFGNSWANTMFSPEENCFHAPYVSFTLWPQKEQVAAICRHASLGDMQSAMWELLCFGVPR